MVNVLLLMLYHFSCIWKTTWWWCLACKN